MYQVSEIEINELSMIVGIFLNKVNELQTLNQ